MKIKITQKQILLQEIKATEDFKFDDAFIQSLKKPGKVAMIRFSDAISGDDVLLTPNISKYTHSHTPAAIYGYPIHNEEVLRLLRNQELQFNNLPIIILYWVDADNIVDINSLTKEQGKDLFDQIISIKGKETVLEALKKWQKREEERATWAYNSSAYNSMPSQLLRNDLNFDTLRSTTAKSYGEIFWNLLREIGTGVEKTALLLKLRLKQKDQDGKEIQKKFNTILDKDATIDIRHPTTGVSQAPVQALTLTSAGLGGYKFYNNPSAVVSRRYKKYGEKSPDKAKIGADNIRRFKDAMDIYLAQMPEIAAFLKTNVKFEKTPEGYKIRLKMPTPSGGAAIQKSIVKRITATKKDVRPPVTEDEISKLIAQRVIGEWLATKDGVLSAPTKIKFDNDIRQQNKMIVEPDGDYFEFNINLRDDTYDVIAPTRVYSLLYFLHYVYTLKTEWNPLYTWKQYQERATTVAKYLK